MPAFADPVDATSDEMIRDIDSLFAIFDRIEWLQFVGGEILLHNGMAKIYEYCIKYRKRFDKLILETNATLLFRDKELAILKEYGESANVMISDYGKMSLRRDDTIKVLSEYGIPFVLKKYHSENQHFGGWVDNTKRKNLNEKEAIIIKKFTNCPQMRLENMHCYSGELHMCPNSLFLSQLNLFKPESRDFVTLTDASTSMEQKRQIIRDFYNHPPKACHFCMWKYADTMPRYPAAEQISQ